MKPRPLKLKCHACPAVFESDAREGRLRHRNLAKHAGWRRIGNYWHCHDCRARKGRP